MRRSIELVRYWDFGSEFLGFEFVTAAKTDPGTAQDAPAETPTAKGSTLGVYKTVSEFLDQAPVPLKDLFGELEAYIEALGDDVSKKTLKYYFAYRRLKNFACVEVHPRDQTLLVFLKVDPYTVDLQPGFARDVRNIGHFGTGDLELRLRTREDLERAQPLITSSYEAS